MNVVRYFQHIMIDKKKYKLYYKELLSNARSITNRYDLMGLMDSYTPIDEYDLETSEIIAFLYTANNIDELVNKIVEVYNSYFEGEFNVNDSTVIQYANELWNLNNNAKNDRPTFHNRRT